MLKYSYNGNSIMKDIQNKQVQVSMQNVYELAH